MRHKIFIVFLALVFIICFFSNFSGPSTTPLHPYDFKYPEAFGTPIIPADNPITVEGVWLGRLLFYDTLLSINGKMSCGTCHRQELSFTDGRALAVGVHGDTLQRNTMTLINLAWGKRFFWDGRVTTLEELVKQPLQNQKEMGGLPEKELIKHLKGHPYYPALFEKAFPGQGISINTVSKAIAQFMRIIVSKPHRKAEDDPRVDLRFIDPNTFNQAKGSISEKLALVMKSKDSVLLKENSLLGSFVRVSYMQCNGCHMTEGFHGEIVTANEHDSLFKAPTLMNAKYTAPYFHDGRYKTLRQVLQFYNDNMETLEINNPDLLEHRTIQLKFNEYDLEHADDLFGSFNDSSINTNPAYSDPFKQKGFTWYGVKNEGDQISDGQSK